MSAGIHSQDLTYRSNYPCESGPVNKYLQWGLKAVGRLQV